MRDYNWLVRNKSTKGFEHDNYLFSFRGGGVFYNELETKVSLTRRKAKRFRVSFIWFLELILNVQYARC